ncbi:MAG: hypothetical protein V4482_04540 [Pseudomonadota bacterium]
MNVKFYLKIVLLIAAGIAPCFAAAKSAVREISTFHEERKDIFIVNKDDPKAREKTDSIKKILGNKNRVSATGATPDEKRTILTAVIGASIVHEHQRDTSYKLDAHGLSEHENLYRHFEILRAAQDLSQQLYASWAPTASATDLLARINGSEDAGKLRDFGQISTSVFVDWFLETASDHQLSKKSSSMKSAGGTASVLGSASSAAGGASASATSGLSQKSSATSSAGGTAGGGIHVAQEGSLEHLLVYNPIPKPVQALINIGRENYSSNVKQLLSNRHDFPRAGGRGEYSVCTEENSWEPTPGWIEPTFDDGKLPTKEKWDEDKIVTHFADLPAPATWTVDEVNQAYNQAIMPAATHGYVDGKFTLVKGVSVNNLHESPLGKDCILQLASQFNYLESEDNNVTSVSSYQFDGTQGPQGSIEAAATTLYRHAAVITSKLPNALLDIMPEKLAIKNIGYGYEYYKNGYLQLQYFAYEDKKTLLQKVLEKKGYLRILPQPAICEATGASQIQVFAAAPSFQDAAMPAFNSTEGQICMELVATQYEAIAKLAVIKSIGSSSLVNLHLTLVGQGSFNNPSEVMDEAFRRVSEIVAGRNVHVYIHGYDGNAQRIIRNACRAYDIAFDEMTRDEFFKEDEGNYLLK